MSGTASVTVVGNVQHIMELEWDAGPAVGSLDVYCDCAVAVDSEIVVPASSIGKVQ